MFAARPFALNTATAALAGVAVRAITTKTTTSSVRLKIEQIQLVSGG